MSLKNYTEKAAELLRRMQIPHIANQLGLRLLWLDVLCADELDGISFEKTHFHSFFEIHFIYGGSISYECRGKNIEIRDGEALFIRPNEPHRCTDYSRDVKKLTLAFSLDASEESLPVFSEDVRLITSGEKIGAAFESVFEICEDKSPIAPGIIAGRMLEVIASVFEFMDIRLKMREDTDTDPRVLIAKRFVKNNLHRSISTADVARECCLSTKQLGRLFEVSTGLSVFAYITAARIEYVKGLLMQKKYSVKEVSYMSGFENVSSFVLFFKRHTGTTPGSFLST